MELTTLREWYQDHVFYKEMELPFYGCDPMGHAKVSTLMQYVSDIAGADYERKGFGHKLLWEREMVFLLSKIRFRIHQSVHPNDRLVLRTWEVGTKGAYFLRDAEIQTQSGQTFVAAKTAWILVNPITRKPYRPTHFDLYQPVFQDLSPDCADPAKIKIPADAPFVGTRRIAYSDLDGNGHTHNANYANFAMDVMPDTFRTRTLRDVQLNFVSEAMLGDDVALFLHVQQDEVIIVGKKGATTCFESRFLYENRDF